MRCFRMAKYEREETLCLHVLNFVLHKLEQPQVEQKVIQYNLTCNSEIR